VPDEAGDPAAVEIVGDWMPLAIGVSMPIETTAVENGLASPAVWLRGLKPRGVLCTAMS